MMKENIENLIDSYNDINNKIKGQKISLSDSAAMIQASALVNIASSSAAVATELKRLNDMLENISFSDVDLIIRRIAGR